LDNLCSDKEIKEIFLDRIKDISGSENIFIVLEGKIDKVTLTKIEKKAKKTVNFELEEKIQNKKDSNVFEIANAFGRRNKKEIWTLYRNYIDNGSAPEEIHGIFFWKIKTMLLSHDFYTWKSEELLVLADDLITLYHEARRGSGDLETKLEIFVLSIK
jgi:hypothetical protein